MALVITGKVAALNAIDEQAGDCLQLLETEGLLASRKHWNQAFDVQADLDNEFLEVPLEAVAIGRCHLVESEQVGFDLDQSLSL